MSILVTDVRDSKLLGLQICTGAMGLVGVGVFDLRGFVEFGSPARYFCGIRALD